MDDSDRRPRIPVGEAELERAVAVWLRVMPPRFMKAFLANLKIDRMRRTGDEVFDARDGIAAHIVSHFRRARWTVSRPEPAAPFNTPYWEREDHDPAAERAVADDYIPGGIRAADPAKEGE